MEIKNSPNSFKITSDPPQVTKIQTIVWNKNKQIKNEFFAEPEAGASIEQKSLRPGRQSNTLYLKKIKKERKSPSFKFLFLF